MIQGWKYYNHAMIPTTAPHENVLLDPVERGKCLKYRGGGIPLLARWTTDWDCGYETEFWYTILDHPFDLDKIKAKHRYQIKQGVKNFEVKEIDFYEYKETLLEITNEVRRKEYGLSSIEKLPTPFDNAVYLGAFDIEERKCVGYAKLAEYSTYIDFTSLKVLPEYEKKSINAALVYAVVDRYKEKLGDIYISNGSRTINHPTHFNEYLIRMFEFRRAYCKLFIRYRWWVKPIVQLLFPFRNILEKISYKKHLLQMILGVLKMEEIARSFSHSR